MNEGLGGWNEAFGGYLYGLRANSYTAEFKEVRPYLLPPFSHAVLTNYTKQAPQKINFTLASQRRPPSPPPSFLPSPSPSPPGSPSRDTTMTGGRGEMTMDSEHSFAVNSAPSGRGRGTGIARGTRGRGRGRGGAAGMTRKKREEMTVSARWGEAKKDRR